MTSTQLTEQAAAALLEMTAPAEERALKHAAGTPSNPSPWLIEAFGGGVESAAGVPVTEMTAMSVSAVFACVRNLAEDEAKLPLITYRRLEPRGKERATDNPIYALLHDSPNEEMTAFDFRQAVMVGAVMWGKGCAEIERSYGGIPTALWPIEPWRICPRRDSSGKLFYEVDGRDRLELDDVLHIKGLSGDGIMGYMMAQVGRDSFGLSIAAQRFAAKFFGNGSRPSGVLTTKKRLDPEGRDRLKAAWQQTYGGIENAHKTPVLEEDTQWVQTSTAPEEAQLLESRQFTVEDVARWFRMPPHKIGHLMRAAGWSTLEATNTDYIIDTLMPWFVRWEQEIKRKLAPGDPSIFAEHLVDGMLRGDAQARAAFYKTMREMGVFNADDIAEMENRNPLPGGQGQAYLVPVNMTTLDRMIEGDAGQTADAGADDSATKTDQQRALIIEAHRPSLADAAARVLRRELEVLRRKLKSPEAFADSVRSFYAEHVEYVRSAVLPSLRALTGTLSAVSGPSVPSAETLADLFAKEYTVSARTQITEKLTECRSRDDFPPRMEAVFDAWEAEKASEMVENLTKIAQLKKVSP
jgi:HK97 family phage portal protein